MKISSIITTGGKCLIASGIFLLFSCDSTQSLTVNGKQTLFYSLHDNEIKIAAGKFGHDYHVLIRSDKAIMVQPDSFQYLSECRMGVLKAEKHRNVGDFCNGQMII